MENPYVVLGIPKNSSPDEVKKAYFNLIRIHSPEKDPEGFKRIRLAYDSLRDMDKRSQTDLFLFNDPYDEFNIKREEVKEYKGQINLSAAIYILTDLSRKDFKDDFSDVPERLEQ